MRNQASNEVSDQPSSSKCTTMTLRTKYTRQPAEQRQDDIERQVFMTCLDVCNCGRGYDSKAKKDHVCSKGPHCVLSWDLVVRAKKE